ncbi:hypothetical protein RF11_13842 [Thelohanellus kitauei]|uniref:Uncharacterized protein n=1 Tax=Thelohanellus kitauei TaxID=669202 RepID=A0A0C2MLG9_THEKT|nr:hypothetical protein RF11_13842 [Thelohanellus kitauei]
MEEEGVTQSQQEQLMAENTLFIIRKLTLKRNQFWQNRYCTIFRSIHDKLFQDLLVIYRLIINADETIKIPLVYRRENCENPSACYLRHREKEIRRYKIDKAPRLRIEY